jgi:cyanate permease
MIGAAAPLAMATHASPFVVMLAFVATGLAGGTFPLFMSIIPAESLAARDVAAGIGLVQGAGELLGGIVAPVFAGFLGARLGPDSTMLMIACCAILASVLTLGIVETAPVQRRETR